MSKPEPSDPPPPTTPPADTPEAASTPPVLQFPTLPRPTMRGFRPGECFSASDSAPYPSHRPVPPSLEQVISFLKEDQVDGIIRPEEFYVTSLPGAVRSERLPGIKTEPEIMTMIQRLVESGRFGWIGIGDFLSWAVLAGVRLAIRSTKDETLTNELLIYRGRLRRHQHQVREQKYHETLNMVVGDIKWLIRSGNIGEAKKYLRESLEEIGGLNVPSLREEMLSAVVAEFPEMWGEIEAQKVAEELAKEAAEMVTDEASGEYDTTTDPADPC